MFFPVAKCMSWLLIHLNQPHHHLLSRSLAGEVVVITQL